jgi:hypothetical protein
VIEHREVAKGPGVGQWVGRGVMFFIVGALTALVCGLVILNIALTLVPGSKVLRVDDIALGRF